MCCRFKRITFLFFFVFLRLIIAIRIDAAHSGRPDPAQHRERCCLFAKSKLKTEQNCCVGECLFPVFFTLALRPSYAASAVFFLVITQWDKPKECTYQAVNDVQLV